MIEIEDLSYRYPGSGAEALLRIGLSIQRGSCFGLLGPNGAGKTTLMSLMTGALNVQVGDIAVDGLSIRNDRLAVMRLGALVPQELAFYPTLTGRANLEFFAGIHELDGNDARRSIADCIEICQLGEFVDGRVATFSGGMKRRLNLAIGLLNRPKILYLDEPTVGIDATSRQSILRAIQDLKTTGMTIVYTSHNMDEVEAICDELAVIDKGKVIARETTRHLLNLASERCLRVSVDAKVPAASIPDIDGLPVRWVDERHLIVSLDDESRLPAALADLISAGVVISQAQYGVARLEEVYSDLLHGS